jgi:thiol-disulfide isomerase/thioredoxin
MIKSSVFFTLPLFLCIQFSCSQNTGLEIGDKAPDLAYPDPDGKIISLESLKGKMVLIDFWASWCPPCRRDNPKVVEAFEHFQDKKFRTGYGFTIYSVSCDQNHEAWVEAIRKDHLVWKNHVSDLKGWEAEATYIYRISAIPSNVLIDSNGIILAKNIEAEQLQAVLASYLKN